MNNIDINDIYILFEEIKELIKKKSEDNTTLVQPEIKLPDLSAIDELSKQLEETITEVRKPVKTEHHHILSIASNKVFFGIIGMGIAILISIFIIYHQREEINTYKDNDLKYRYIKMQGEITSSELVKLENIFENKRDSVRIIHKQVNQYEKAVTEGAKRLEKARLKELEAEKFREEAENLKQKK